MEEERTREELVEQINELALTERTDLVPEVQEDGGSSDMLIGAAVGAGAAGLIAAGMWLWNRHKRKKAEKAAKKELEKENEPVMIDDDDDDQEEPEEKPEKESKKKDK